MDFGDKVDVQAMFDYLLRIVPKMCATDAEQLWLHYYETQFGIFDHDNHPDKDHPLALVMMRDAEKTGDRLFERIREFEQRQIYSRFGTSLKEFLSLPREVVEYMLSLSLEKQKEHTEQQERMLQDFVDGKGEGS